MQQNKQNYFQLFDIPESFEVNQELLGNKYRALQGEWHPDRFVSADEPQKLQAVQMSSLLNQAYDALKSPLSRAGYLLTLNGCDLEHVRQQDLGMELLTEQMQLREALEDLPEDDSALATLADPASVRAWTVDSVSQNSDASSAPASMPDDLGGGIGHDQDYLAMRFRRCTD